MMRSVVCIVGAALVFAACGGHDKAGGAAVARAPTIEIATQNGSPHYLSAYVRALGRDTAAPTHMTVRTSVRAAEVNGEAAIVRDVSAGRIDFALVSARVLDTLGVDALQPLLAPARRSTRSRSSSACSPVTFRSGCCPRSRSLASSASRCCPVICGIRSASRGGWLVPPTSPVRRFGIRRSALPRRVFEQLGASVVLNRGESYPGVDGIEADLTIIEGEEADVGAESLAADLALWPRIFVVIANPDAWDGLDPQRRRALRDGGRIALPTAIDILRGRDAEAYGVLCRRGEVAFVQTTPDDANAFRRALAPVTRTLDTAALAEIARVRAAVGPPPTHPRCHRPARIRPGPETAIDGVWDVHERRRRPARHGAPGLRGHSGQLGALRPRVLARPVHHHQRIRRGVRVGLRDVPGQ